MNHEITDKTILDMQQHLTACNKYLREAAKGFLSAEKCNTLLDAAMQQVELCCLEMRKLCEKARPKITLVRFGCSKYEHREIYGSVMRMENGWLDICLNTLLPHCKILGGTQYIADSITRLLDEFQHEGDLAYFEKAYIAIVEHCPWDVSGVFDSDNKGFKGVINALKGRLFPDDNQFELSLGLFTVQNEEFCCHIYVTPFDDAGDFLYQLSSEML